MNENTGFNMPNASATQLASTAAEGASDEVRNAFDKATNYANEAWATAQNVFEALGEISFDDIPEIEVNFKDVISEAKSADNPKGIASPDGSEQSESKQSESDNAIEFPDEPEQPTISDSIDIPGFPEMVDTLQPLSDYDLKDAVERVVEKIEEFLKDKATGLDPEVEQAIWDRALARKEIQNLKMQQEAEEYFAARGYELPPGALVARLQEIQIEVERENLQTNNDIMIAQAQLEQSNFHTMIKEGTSVFLSTVEKELQIITEQNKILIAAYAAELERFKATLEARVVPMKAAADIYAAKSQGFAARCSGLAEQVRAQSVAIGAETDIAKATADIAIKNAEIKIGNVRRVIELQIEALKATAQVTGQIAASSLASINASASFGFSAGASLSQSDTTSRAINNNWSSSYSKQQTEILSA